MSHCSFSQMDDEPFNPDYVEVDRVLDVSESTDENGEVCVCVACTDLFYRSVITQVSNHFTVGLNLSVCVCCSL